VGCPQSAFQIAGQIPDFDPKQHGVPRKSLKVMARDAQIGVAASVLAGQDAGIVTGRVDPERFGVVLGADRICSSLEHSEPPYRACLVDGRFDFDRWGREGMVVTFPLSFLRVLPNMIASHISIAHDARGPNNTIHHAEVSSLLAVAEAARVIERGMADVMLAGGASSELNPFDHVRLSVYGRVSREYEAPAAVARPFDAGRTGEVRGEGATVFVLESRRHAEARGATILGRIAGWATACEPRNGPLQGTALRQVIGLAVERAGWSPRDVGHINAQGFSTRHDDALEAQAICGVLGNTPVTAPSSFFGNLSAAGGATEMAASVLGLRRGLVPPTLNYDRPDPGCPLRVVAGDGEPSPAATALMLNWTPLGQAVAVAVASA
jgi:3-oxoacyl-[acyl-carrier-protein] synthase II